MFYRGSTVTDIDKNYQFIKEEISKSQTKENVIIIGVSKYVSDETVKKAIDLGVNNFGENRADNYLRRKKIFPNVTWHLIGTLQTRKVKDVINEVDYFHALDRLKLAEEINKRADRIIDCFLQVNVSEEKTKHGIKIEEINEFLNAVKNYPKVKIVGLMTMAPNTNEENIIKNYFEKLKELQLNIKLRNLPYAPCEYLSMGMSNDYNIALEAGATHIRIGTSLLGNAMGND